MRKKVIITDDQEDVFSVGGIKQAHINAAKDILLAAGYRIIKPEIVNGEITSKRKLRDYFYMRLNEKHPTRQLRRVPDIILDMKLVGQFVDSRLDGGITEKDAIQECVAIINVLFDQEDEFKFKYPISDIGILGQGKMAWITAKAISLLNKNKDARAEQDALKMSDEIEDSNVIDIKEQSNYLDSLLKNLEGN